MPLIDIVAIVWTLVGIAIVPLQLHVTAPYGRHASAAWGPTISNRLGWCLMELVSLVVFGGLFLLGPNMKTAPMRVFFALWSLHYINRSLIFPWRTKTRGKRMPLAIVASAAGFNIVNGGLNGLYLGWFGPPYPTGWTADPRFIIGLLVFVAGAAINLTSDNRLIALRGEGKSDYSIPHGGLFDRVSSPNLFGEIVEWSGFALMCWNFPALSFAVWTAANLIPRALSHHAWYKTKFPDYPPERKAVIPGLL
jgi:3-oxo-5-alpha-steroid 4-dehydrogenase 1